MPASGRRTWPKTVRAAPGCADADAEVGGVIAGVGQRMLAAVAKKTAGEFFAAIDDVLTGTPPDAVEAAAAHAAAGRTFVAPASARRESADLLSGAVVGGVIALAGVLVGRWIGRRP